MNACHGPCEQGKKRCGTPDACQLPEDDAVSLWSDLAQAGMWTVLLVFLVMAGIGGAVAFVYLNWPSAVWLVGSI